MEAIDCGLPARRRGEEALGALRRRLHAGAIVAPESSVVACCTHWEKGRVNSAVKIRMH